MTQKILFIWLLATFFSINQMGFSAEWVQSNSVSGYSETGYNTSVNEIFSAVAIAEDEKTPAEKPEWWKRFLFPPLNIFHLVFILVLVLLYIKNKGLRKQLFLTRSKLRSNTVKLNRRIDQLTHEQREIIKRVKRPENKEDTAQ